MKHPLFDHVLFINLESRKDRFEHVIMELNKLELPNEYQRFPGIYVEGNGTLGCALSHLQCLEIAKERNYPFVFICEDDITFLQPHILLENVQKFWDESLIAGWDVLIISGNNYFPFEEINEYLIRVHCCATTTGYIIANHYYDTLINNFKESVYYLTQSPNYKEQYAIDVNWRNLQKEHKWYMIIPPTVTQYSNYSNIENNDVDYDTAILNYKKPYV